MSVEFFSNRKKNPGSESNYQIGIKNQADLQTLRNKTQNLELESESSSLTTIIVLLIVIIIAVLIFLLIKRKVNKEFRKLSSNSQ